MKVYEVRFFGDEIRKDYIKVKNICFDFKFKILLFNGEYAQYGLEMLASDLYYIHKDMTGFGYINSLKELSAEEIEKIKRYIKRKAGK